MLKWNPAVHGGDGVDGIDDLDGDRLDLAFDVLGFGSTNELRMRWRIFRADPSGNKLSRFLSNKRILLELHLGVTVSKYVTD